MRQRHRLYLRLSLLIAGCLLLTAGLLLLGQRWHASQHSDTSHPANKAVTVTTDKPSETKPDSARYMVATDQPRRIILPDSQIDSLIQQVGRDQHGNIASPNNVHLAGWYNGSVKPGQPGLSIIDGHVQGYYNPGAFKRLSSSRPGQPVIVEYGDGSTRQFTISRAATVTADEADQKLYDRLPGVDRQLTLITCAGRYDKQRAEYDQRVIVYAIGR